MAEDVKVLREAAANFEEWFQHGNVQQLWPREQKALAILCARMADMIEREEPEYPFTTDWPKPGDIMRFTNFGGYDGERADAAKIFSLDGAYVVEDFHLGRFHSYIEFKTIPGRFNSVMFERVTPPTPDTLQAAEDRGWNAALEAAVYHLSELGMASVNSPFADAIRSLRREPRP